MNAKQLKYLQLFAQMSKTENLTAEKELFRHFKGFLELDYALALEVWDYLCTTYEPQLSEKNVAVALGQKTFEQFYQKAPGKCVKALYEIPPIRRAVFQYNPSACTGDSFTLTVEALCGNKIAEAEEIFKCLVKNPHISFGQTLKALLERLFIEILKKSSAKKIEMSKKLSSLLLSYIAKIKTDERSMLEQRVRETL